MNKDDFMETVIDIGATLLLALLFMILWNMFIPNIFKLPTINYLEALALNVMGNILFKRRVK